MAIKKDTKDEGRNDLDPKAASSSAALSPETKKALPERMLTAELARAHLARDFHSTPSQNR